MWRRAFLAGAVVLAGQGCAKRDIVATALHGDLATLRTELDAARRGGTLDREQVEDVAQAVAGREVRSAQGTTAVDHIRAARACMHPLVPVLEDRATRPDDAGAEATLALLEGGVLSPSGLLRQHGASSSAPWRAVAARAATSPEDGPQRRAFVRDPDERVRRAAVAAAEDAATAADLGELLEAARLDPDTLTRARATRAVGVIGGERAVLGLKDLWARADPQERITVVDAWSMARSLEAGGERELVWAAETSGSLPALAAAEALVRTGSRSAEVGLGVLVRGAGDGSWTERTLALRVLPLEESRGLDAVVLASEDEDVAVRVVALARLATHPRLGAGAAVSQRELAEGTDDVARRARAALAAAGDRAATVGLARDLGSTSPAERISGAVGLFRLGDYPAAAAALADENPRVRLQVACAMLAARGGKSR